jgi:hypothetical protein
LLGLRGFAAKKPADQGDRENHGQPQRHLNHWQPGRAEERQGKHSGYDYDERDQKSEHEEGWPEPSLKRVIFYSAYDDHDIAALLKPRARCPQEAKLEAPTVDAANKPFVLVFGNPIAYASRCKRRDGSGRQHSSSETGDHDLARL